MKCLKCAAEIPDNSSFCPLCGELVVKEDQPSVQQAEEKVVPTVQPIPVASVAGSAMPQAVPTTPVTGGNTTSESGTAPAPTEKKDSVFSGLGGFFKSYFKNPIQSVVDHSSSKYWVWGLCVPILYVFLRFLISLTSISFVSFGGVMSQLFTRTGYSFSIVLRFATLIFVYFLLQKLFKVEKCKSLKEIVSVTGLAFLPIIPVYLIQIVFNRVEFLWGFSNGLELAVYAIAALVLFEEMKRYTDDKSTVKSFLCVVISFASMPLIENFNDMIIGAISKLFSLF